MSAEHDDFVAALTRGAAPGAAGASSSRPVQAPTSPGSLTKSPLSSGSPAPAAGATASSSSTSAAAAAAASPSAASSPSEFNIEAEIAALRVEDFVRETGLNGDLVSDLWTLCYNRNELKLYQKKFSKPYICTRELKRIHAAGATVVRLLEDFSVKRRKWDSKLIDSEVIQQFPAEQAKVVRLQYAATTVHRARELVILERQIVRDNATFVLFRSVNHPATPRVSRIVRAELGISGYMVRSYADAASGDSCDVAFLQQMDPKHLITYNNEEAMAINVAKTLGLERIVMPRTVVTPMSDERRRASMRLAKKIVQMQDYLNERLATERSPSPSPQVTPTPGSPTPSSSIEPSQSLVPPQHAPLGRVPSKEKPNGSSRPGLGALGPQLSVEEASRQGGLRSGRADSVDGDNSEVFLSLQDVLHGVFSRIYYARFLESEFSVENLDFWLAVEAFKAAYADETDEDCLSHAIEVFSSYVLQQAPFVVNLSTQVRSALKESYDELCASTERPPISLFDDAQRQIFNLMRNDTYRRFLDSELYGDMLEYLSESGGGANVHIEMLRDFVAEVGGSTATLKGSISPSTSDHGQLSLVANTSPSGSAANFANALSVGAQQQSSAKQPLRAQSSMNAANTPHITLNKRPASMDVNDLVWAPTGAASSSMNPNPPHIPGGATASGIPVVSGIRWVLTEHHDGTDVFKKFETKPVRCRRYRRVINAPEAKLWNALMDMSEARAKWMPKFVSAQVVESLNDCVTVFHLNQGPPFHARRARDFCVLRVVLQNDRVTGDKYILFRSITHRACPETKDGVRCKMWTSGFMVSPIPNKKDAFTVVFMQQVDWRITNLERLVRSNDDKLTLFNLQRVLNES
ncbi:hypothetical protein CAOG_08514 [Capsaspora owczarzaki ATCC 30864]|uniref:RGS domain-containing protein n=1 Tax=Capsaspora owczarzaki (strain ATCC 30864) TaxID=595528 RepID=A0A0D2X140_CAPO3|nr:hypothetical protein CAOG_08514 [Capsaspora owczarzaki ATCC 30864]KJE90144.1 hypothetical protein CAOG_008514 [Capsaspora owczarzaki ATCC 30864]|eukprot:XP_011270096.1 hypothetical protein CAOG_08514 [Capsaspora owczarzaki ATCC 30864]